MLHINLGKNNSVMKTLIKTLVIVRDVSNNTTVHLAKQVILYYKCAYKKNLVFLLITYCLVHINDKL